MKGRGSGPQDADGVQIPEVPPSAAFFLDMDGTLLHIAETPEGVPHDLRLVRLVEGLSRAAGGAVALISGRPISDVDRLLAPARLPIAGQHGLERRDAAGSLHRHVFPEEGLEAMRRGIRGIAARYPAVRVEDKGLSVALHFRQAPALGPQIERELGRLLAEAGDGFRLQPGKMVFEIKPAGRDKGTAIAEFMGERPFRGRIPVFLGDDTTDEYGFAMVNAMGGQSIKVGAGSTAAQWRLPDVESVRAWLERWTAAAMPSGGDGVAGN
ncbi:MAG: trehalose-phosphatase [Betaproteobacteria bacterium]|nr:trehalose-phosphatase [Betaproteobacteria bacterium]